MKKLICVVLCCVMLACLLTGCAKTPVEGFWVMETETNDLGLNIHGDSAQMYMLSEDNPDRLLLMWDATLTKSQNSDGWVAVLTEDSPSSFAGVFPDGTWVVPSEDGECIVLIYEGALHGQFYAADIKRIRDCEVVNVDKALDLLYDTTK